MADTQERTHDAGTRSSYVGVTVNQYIAMLERQNEEATGELSNVLMEIVVACKLIGSIMKRAGIADVLGKANTTNETGDVQAKLDVQSNDVMKERLLYMSAGHGVCAYISEEEPDVIYPHPDFAGGKYIVATDPLDGSSNIDCNVPVGTIFGIFRRQTDPTERVDEERDLKQIGRNMVAAGYVLYGPSVVMVMTIGGGTGVHGFTLDPSIGEFVLSHEDMKIPDRVKCFSVNEGNWPYWNDHMKAYIDWIKTADPETKRPYGGRYVGSLVSDFHRNLLYGGIYMYPGDSRNASGKLRVLYENGPLSLIAEEAGGRGSNGETDILDILVENIHERAPLFIGNKAEVDRAERFLRGEYDE